MSRSLKHWNLQYARDRLRLSVFSITHPGAPWLCPECVYFLDTWLQPTFTGFEWGAGRSTIWFADRVETVVSIEHDADWYRRVQQSLLARPQNNVDLKLIPADSAEYCAAIDRFADGTLDFVLVDGVGELRDTCALQALPKLRNGGALIVDDIHRYLPASSRSPNALRADAPPATNAWADFSARVEPWQLRRFSSGVTDTAIWFAVNQTEKVAMLR